MSAPGDADDAGDGWLRLLRPLVTVYAAGLALKNTAYARHWLPIRELEAPVISVGNLSVGGAGKTPLAIRLAELLAARGFAVDVLSRGYGRRFNTEEQVRVGAPDSLPLSDAERYGDEPLLIARESGVPVYVGANRYAAGLLAEQRVTARPRVHLLDDGFQHRQLARAVDIVVLHRSDFTAGLLPAGRLREPLSALRRASIAVLRVEDAAFEPELRRRFANLAIWWIAREIVLPADPAPGPAVAFCGIAHPGEFFAALALAGARLSARHAFRDHHAYTDADVLSLTASAQATGARTLLTTEKDLVRLSPPHRELLGQAARLTAVPLRARLLEEESSLTRLLGMAGLLNMPAPHSSEPVA